MQQTQYQILPMTEEYAKQISHWTYEGEYSIYSFQPDEETLAELLDGSYFACTFGQELVGYFCFGASATIPTVPGSVSLPQGDFLDFGLGMRPDLCGQGRGKEFMQAGLLFGKQKFHAASYRLAVAAWNKRAQHLYQKMGFVTACEVIHRFSKQPFYIMIQTVTDAEERSVCLDFHRITLQDKEWMEELLGYSNYNSCEYSFTDLFNWGFVHQTEVARMGDFGVIRSGFKEFSYLYPFVRGDVKPVIEAMMQDAKEHNVYFTISLLLDPMKAELETLFPGQFEFTEERAYFDYIYLRESLVELKGKKLHGKKNHLNAFKNTYPDWKFEHITSENIDECWQMNEEWSRQNEMSLGSGLLKEKTALRTAFDNFFEEGLVGGLIRVDGKVIAYSMGHKLNSDTFVVHFEKAFADIRGAYQIINQQFAQHCCEGYTYINREDDTGLEGLRKAKLSYLPQILLTKYDAKLVSEQQF